MYIMLYQAVEGSPFWCKASDLYSRVARLETQIGTGHFDYILHFTEYLQSNFEAAALLGAGKEINLELNTEKTMWLCVVTKMQGKIATY